MIRRSLLAASVLATVLLTSGCVTRTRTHFVTPGEWKSWTVAGIGTKQVLDGGVLKLTEGKGSKGVVLLSPRAYTRDLGVRFKVKPLQRKGVCVVILCASNVAGGRPLPIPEKYDGNFGLWIGKDGGIRNYALGFHTGYHQPNAFLTRNPGFADLANAPDPASGEQWYTIEIRRSRRTIALFIDGKPVLETRDTDSMLPGGYIGLRLRGPGDGSFACLYKEMAIAETR